MIRTKTTSEDQNQILRLNKGEDQREQDKRTLRLKACPSAEMPGVSRKARAPDTSSWNSNSRQNREGHPDRSQKQESTHKYTRLLLT